MERRPGESEDRRSEDRRTPRRASLPAPAGSDPEPETPVETRAEGENDERLRRDRPPHWG